MYKYPICGRYYILFLLFGIIGQQQYLYAQETNTSLNICIQEAENAFRSGRPEVAIERIETCLKDGSQSRKLDLVNAYRLLTLAYLENGQRAEAEANFEELLWWDPEFDISELPTEDADLLMLLYKSFRTEPIYLVGVDVGANFSQVDVLQQFSAANTTSINDTFKIGSGFQAGIYFSLPLMNRNIRLASGASFINRNYNHIDYLQTSTTNSLNFAKLTNRENQSVLQVPLLLSIDFDRWNTPEYQRNTIVPFVYGGLSLDYIFRARMSEISRINEVGASENGLADPNIGQMRRDMNYSLVIGGGMKYKIYQTYIYFNIKYTQGINNLVNPQKRYSNDELLYLFGYVDDDFRMRMLSITLGIEQAFYKPKKLNSRKKKKLRF